VAKPIEKARVRLAEMRSIGLNPGHGGEAARNAELLRQSRMRNGANSRPQFARPNGKGQPSDKRSNQEKHSLTPCRSKTLPISFEDNPGEQRYALDESQLDRGVLTTPYDAPVRTLLLELQDKSLAVNPIFQRYSVWNQRKQSKLIESLLLNIPIPVLYFAEDEDGTRVVVDGQQRLRTIDEFYSGRLRLRGLQVLPSLNRMRWTDLTTKHANLFLRRTLRCVVISATSPQSLRFEMFERLNTGGVPLNDQELRNCIFHGALNDLLRGLSANQIWQQALGLEEPDQRMADMELALRYFALRSNLNNYKPPLKEALNDYMKTHRNPSEESLAALNEVILSTVEKVRSVFGDKLFRRVRVLLGKTENPTLWDRGINRAVFDIQMLAFESLDSNWLTEHRSNILSAFEELCSTDAGFIDSVTSATANRSAVITRLRKWGLVLARLGEEPAYLAVLPHE
jgi:hypothetical protein